jgi:hypothetical protein
MYYQQAKATGQSTLGMQQQAPRHQQSMLHNRARLSRALSFFLSFFTTPDTERRALAECMTAAMPERYNQCTIIMRHAIVV